MQTRGRRANGEGSRPQKHGNRVRSRVTVTDPQTGVERRIWVSADNTTKLAEKVRETLNAVDAGLAPVESRATLADYAEQWLTHTLAARDVTDSTRRLYRLSITNHVVPQLGSVRLDALRASHVERLNAALRRRGLADSTRKLAYRMLSMMLATAKRDGLIRANPAELVTAPKERPTMQPHYSPAEFRRLCATVAHVPIFAAIVPLLAYTGMRPGEAFALRWADVDFDGSRIMVRATVSVGEDNKVVRQLFPKSKRSHELPMLPTVAAALRSWRAVQGQWRMAAGSAWQDEGLVFTDELGQLLDDRNVRTRYRPLVLAAGLAGSFHALRRSCGTLLTAAKVPLPVVSMILGHASTSVTSRHYTYVDMDMMREAMTALEQRMAL